MEKGRWIFTVIIVIGAFTVGRRQLEPLWDFIRKDPLVGILIVLVLIVLIRLIVRVLQS
jgi:hypothetical protein